MKKKHIKWPTVRLIEPQNFDSLGVDTHAEDPICEFNLSTEGYIQIGRIISTTRRPTLFVLEG